MPGRLVVGIAPGGAAGTVAHAAPDGQTVLQASPSGISVNPALNPRLACKFSDLQPVPKGASSPLVTASRRKPR